MRPSSRQKRQSYAYDGSAADSDEAEESSVGEEGLIAAAARARRKAVEKGFVDPVRQALRREVENVALCSGGDMDEGWSISMKAISS